MSEQNNLPVQLRFKSKSIIQSCQRTLDATQSLYVNNRDFLSLCADDRSTLVHGTFMHTASISSNFICYKIRLMDYPTYYDTIEIISSARIASIARCFPARLNFDMVVMKLLLAILSLN